MRLTYFELISPEPIYMQNTGSIISPKLRDISLLGYHTYQTYLAILLIDPKSYLTMTGNPERYDSLSLFELLTANKQSRVLLQDMLNFFISEDVIYSPAHHHFIVKNNDKIVGIIAKENYPQLCNFICQRISIKSNQEEDLSNIKSKKALEIMQKLQKGRAEKAKQTKTDKNMELGNIISAVAGKSYSLNIVNIWDLTVFQLWDCFSRLSNNNIYDIQSMSVAAWGDKDNHFDATTWFKRIDN